MTLENMHEFISLAELRNFQLAAERLFTTQASLSRHIMSMEEELGFPLFSRTHKRVELTDNGFRFLVHARRAMEIQQRYSEDFARKLREAEGQLSIGAHRSSTYYEISELLGSFSKQFSNTIITVTEAGTDALRDMVRSGSCDFAFVREPQSSHRTMNCFQICQDSLTVVLSDAHPLGTRTSVSLEELRYEEFMLPPENSTMRNVYMSILQTHGINPRHSVIAGNAGRNILHFVKQGMCVALYWKKTAEAISGQGTTVVDIAPAESININILYKDDRTSNVKNSFLNFVRNYVRQKGLNR